MFTLGWRNGPLKIFPLTFGSLKEVTIAIVLLPMGRIIEENHDTDRHFKQIMTYVRVDITVWCPIIIEWVKISKTFPPFYITLVTSVLNKNSTSTTNYHFIVLCLKVLTYLHLPSTVFRWKQKCKISWNGMIIFSNSISIYLISSDLLCIGSKSW